MGEPNARKSQQLQIRVTSRQKQELRRLAGEAGLDVSTYVLLRALPPDRIRFTELLGELRKGADHRYLLAELNDLLTGLPPGRFGETIATADLAGLTPLLQNYVAAMVEMAAGQKGEAPPPWVRGVEPLEEPYFAVTFGALRPHLLRAAPVPFRRRNLFVDAAVGDRV
jgi:hypothetical protein